MSDSLDKIQSEVSNLLNEKIPSLIAAALKEAQEEFFWALPEKDKRFELTDYFFEGDSFYHWEKYSTQSINKTGLNIFTFESDPCGTAPIIGNFGGHPICVSFFWYLVNGHYVCFYNPTSNVVNWKMVEKWITKRKRDNVLILRNFSYYFDDFRTWGPWKSLQEINKKINNF